MTAKHNKRSLDFIGCSPRKVAYWCMHGDPSKLDSLIDGWSNKQTWDWAIRVKSDLLITTDGRTQAVEGFFPPPEQTYLVEPIRVLGDIDAHLATANVPRAQDTWAVLLSQSACCKPLLL